MAEDTATAQTGASGAEADGKNQPDNTKRSSRSRSSSSRKTGKGSSSSKSSSSSSNHSDTALKAVIDRLTSQGGEGGATWAAELHSNTNGKYGAPLPGTNEDGEAPDA